VRLRRNFENGFTQTQTLRLDDVPGVDSTDTTQTARAGAWGSASVGLNKVVPRRRSVARALTIDLSDVHRLQFEIEVTAPVRMALISMEMEVTDLDVEQGRRLATATET
jgi:hypothetical protein